MKRNIGSMCRLLPAAMLACSLMTSALAASPEIIVLSNRADLLSGVDAFVQINHAPAVHQAVGVKAERLGGDELHVHDHSREPLLRPVSVAQRPVDSAG